MVRQNIQEYVSGSRDDGEYLSFPSNEPKHVHKNEWCHNPDNGGWGEDQNT